jgi:hypothetical protein
MKYIWFLPPSWLRVERRVGEILPPWYYMRGYTDWCTDQQFFYFIPLALLIRAYHWSHYWWNWLRSRPTMHDQEVLKTRTEFFRRGYDAGREHGMELGKQEAWSLIDAKLKEKESEFRKRTQEGS